MHERRGLQAADQGNRQVEQLRLQTERFGDGGTKLQRHSAIGAAGLFFEDALEQIGFERQL